MNRNGAKAYVPWVMLSNGDWVSMEPDGGLPFWKPRKATGPGAKIMIHEGAKAASFVDRLIQNKADHPWIEELSQYEHWGQIGGALAPHRTEYDELSRESPTEVIYVCDNDQPGAAALQKVSRCWGKSLKGINFGKAFPPSWDMADPIPANLISKAGRYIGPSLREMTEAATWATDKVPNGSGKGAPITVMKTEFVEEWMHCVTPEVFVHKDWPNRVLTTTEFNNRVAPFSDVDETARILKKHFASKAAVLKYVPGEQPGIYGGSSSGLYINTFLPTNIKSEKGDDAPWIDFMKALIPDDGDRFELLRWIATLVARPDIKMLYGVLMISEMQGVGKGTLGEKVLAPLVGDTNVSFPSEQEIVESNYNYWLAHKRLAVVHEIYAGNSSKAYNKLKSTITDKNLTVQKKYQANYDVENCIHVYANSNSFRAIKLSMDDRRWFVPKVSEEKRPPEYWEAFNVWLTQEGGLSIILAWAIDFVETHGPVPRGADAPWSALKKTIVEEAYSPGQMIISRTLETFKLAVDEGQIPADAYLTDLDLVTVVRNELYEGRHNDHLERPATARAVAKAAGFFIGETRAQVKNWGSTQVGARVISLDAATANAIPSTLGGRPMDLGKLGAM